MPTVSIVINVYNAASLIPALFKQLRQQSFTDFEIIMVDDGSTDQTVNEIAQQAGSLNTRTIQLPHVGLRQARAVGVNTAQGEIVLIVDADETFGDDFIARMIAPFARSTVGAVGARLVSLGDNWVIQGSNVVRQLKHLMRKDKEGRPWMLPGGCMAVRKSVVDQVGGFIHDSAAAGDYDISRKIRAHGFDLVSLDDVLVYHPDPDSLRGIFRRQFKVGERVLPSLRLGGGSLSAPKMLMPIFYTVGLFATLIFLVYKLRFGLILLALIGGGVIFSFRKTTTSLKQKAFAWIVLTTDCFGYTWGVVNSLISSSS